MTGGTTAHPWMANSVEATKSEMLATIGASSIAELFQQSRKTIASDRLLGCRRRSLRSRR